MCMCTAFWLSLASLLWCTHVTFFFLLSALSITSCRSRCSEGTLAEGGMFNVAARPAVCRRSWIKVREHSVPLWHLQWFVFLFFFFKFSTNMPRWALGIVTSQWSAPAVIWISVFGVALAVSFLMWRWRRLLWLFSRTQAVTLAVRASKQVLLRLFRMQSTSAQVRGPFCPMKIFIFNFCTFLAWNAMHGRGGFHQM